MTERKKSHGLWFPNTFTFIQTYQNLFKKYSEGRAEGNAIFSISCQRQFPCLGKKHWLTITHRRIQFYTVTKSLIGKIFLISNLLLFNMRVLFFRHMELKKLQSTNEVLTCLDHVKLYSVNSINYQTIDNLIYDHMWAVKRQSLIILALNNWFHCIFVWTSTTRTDQCRWSNDQFFFQADQGARLLHNLRKYSDAYGRCRTLSSNMLLMFDIETGSFRNTARHKTMRVS